MRHRVPLRLLLTACVCILLLTSAVVTLLQPPSQSSKTRQIMSPASSFQGHGGKGGYNAMTAGTTPTATLDPITEVYICQGIRSTPKIAVTVLWPGMVAFLSLQYQNAAAILCFDKWTWKTTNCTMRLSEILEALNWPADLFTSPQRDYVQCVGPLSNDQLLQLRGLADPNPTTKQSAQQEKTCVWIADKIKIDICSFLHTLVHIVVVGLRNGLTDMLEHIDFVWSTPALYDDTVLTKWWGVSLGAITILVMVIIGWAGLRYMFGSFSWLAYAQLMELIPRIIFGLLLASLSLQITKVLIQGINALNAIFPNDTILYLANSDPPRTSLLVIQGVYILAIFALTLEEISRFALLFVLIAFSPFWFFAASLRETQDIAKTGTRGLILLALVQPIQKAILVLGIDMLKNLTGSEEVTLLTFLAALGIVALALTAFFSISRSVLGGVSIPATATALGGSVAAAGLTARTLLRGGRKVTEFVSNQYRQKIHEPYVKPSLDKAKGWALGKTRAGGFHALRYGGNAALMIAEGIADVYGNKKRLGRNKIGQLQEKWDARLRGFARATQLPKKAETAAPATNRAVSPAAPAAHRMSPAMRINQNRQAIKYRTPSQRRK